MLNDNDRMFLMGMMLYLLAFLSVGETYFWGYFIFGSFLFYKVKKEQKK